MIARLMLAALCAASLGAPLGAQQKDPLRQAYDLERRGSFAEAAEAYRGVLARTPAEPAALFGLERSLIALNRLPEILPQARAALAASPKVGAFYAVVLRAFAAAQEPDSVRETAAAWAAATPGDEAPYREWGAAALARRDRAEARRAYLAGRARLGRRDALAPELAQLAAAEGNWSDALGEWLAAMVAVPDYRASAAASVGAAPPPARPGLLQKLAADGGGAARRLEGDLRARWGDPVGGFEALARGLPPERAQAAEALRGFLDQVRTLPGPAARRAAGLALEALAQRTSPAESARLRLEAAQAFADAGDQAGARRMLGGVAADGQAPGEAAASATTTLVGVLLSEGKLEEAERKLAEARTSLASEEWLALQRRVAWAWARAGRLGRADSLVAADSSVDGLALAGRLRLLRGDIRGATERLAAAGPYAGTREEATSRTGLLAMLQPLEADTLPALGAALLKAEQGDTAGAVAGLERVAAGLAPERGGADLRLYAGRLARAAGKTADAERLFRAADVASAKATAPAAELALGRLLLDLDRLPEAVKVLEQLILAHPESALVPEARRALDEARGAVPRT
ncbi:MAG TPA: hypothetical protein VFK09_03360 [Gemmatimonadales bacterium]|nr:hypothetical protein [Gemmatimonadales bacterium]